MILFYVQTLTISNRQLLEKKLNDDNDVKAFACAVRHSFKKLC